MFTEYPMYQLPDERPDWLDDGYLAVIERHNAHRLGDKEPSSLSTLVAHDTSHRKSPCAMRPPRLSTMANRALVAAAWRAASEDLGIRVEIGWPLSGEDGRFHECVAFIPDFGTPAGTVVFVADDNSTEVMALARERGLLHAELHDAYQRYDRGLFVETLDDWQWHGIGEPPGWYSGTPWTN